MMVSETFIRQGEQEHRKESWPQIYDLETKFSHPFILCEAFHLFPMFTNSGNGIHIVNVW